MTPAEENELQEILILFSVVLLVMLVWGLFR